MPNALVLPAKGISKPYEGTPADKIVRMTQDMANMRLGDPAKAAQRILEVVTGTGMATSEEVKGCLRAAGQRLFEGRKGEVDNFWEELGRYGGDCREYGV
jgi:hypothetical protein